MSPATSTPDTIVLIHGFWVTPRSWEHWIDPLRGQGVPRPRDRLSRLRGRGRGTQRRPDARSRAHRPRDHRAARVRSSASSTRRRSSWATPPAVCSPRSCSTTASAPPASPSTRLHRGRRVHPALTDAASFPVLKNPANRHKAVGFTFEQWHYAFTNTFPEDESARCTSDTTSRLRADLLGQRARQHPPRPRTTPGSTTTTTTARRCCSSPAARPPHAARSSGPTLSTTVETSPKSRSTPGPTSCPPSRAGKRSPTARSTGPCATPHSRARGDVASLRRGGNASRAGSTKGAILPEDLFRAQLGEPHHHAYVVDDIEATVNRLVDQLGAGPFFLIENVPLENVVSRGEPAEFVHNSAFGSCDGSAIELIEVVSLAPERVENGFSGARPASPARRLCRAGDGGRRLAKLARRARPDAVPELPARRRRNDASRRLRDPRPRHRDPCRQPGTPRELLDGERRCRGLGWLGSAASDRELIFDMSIVIVGAGPNLGLGIARRFGTEGLPAGLLCGGRHP